ncbi:MAG: FAD-binding oxidoreductase [Myxococcaceae bacterium]|nr:FAD-binding oxidoreductase [Myxococcaceae bacterium]
MRVIVIGGGIAGLSVALGLARRGARVTLLERSLSWFAGASGVNAAIYRPLEDAAVMTAFARRNAVLLDELLGHRTSWLDARGLVFIGATKTVRRLVAEAADAGLRSQHWKGEVLLERLPVLEGGRWTEGLWLAAGGVIDLHRVARALEAACRRADVDLVLRAEVTQVARSGELWQVTVRGAPTQEADAVVLAAGAHSAKLGVLAGSALRLRTFKRTLALLEPEGPRVGHVVWDVTTETYFRRESGGVLACPCDDDPSGPDSTFSVSQDALASLGDKLQPVAPVLADSRVRRAWAGLRTFSEDGLPVLGADPDVAGLFWCTGFGGAGMTTGVALGDVAARAVLGDAVPRELAASRFGARSSLAPADASSRA